jgi:hypothetical protein
MDDGLITVAEVLAIHDDQTSNATAEVPVSGIPDSSTALFRPQTGYYDDVYIGSRLEKWLNTTTG